MNTSTLTAPGEREVLVIGGAGYVGTALTRELLSSGYRVRVVDNLLYGHGFAVRQFLSDPNYTFIKGDLRNAQDMENALDGVSDVVLLAGLVGDPICKKYSDMAKAVNLDACLNLYNMLNGRGLKRFVFASTCSNYGLRDTDDLATEESDLNPVSLYAECKVAVEKHILANGSGNDFASTILRIATAYGISQRMRFDLTISEFTREMAMGRELLVYDENTWRPYCHIVDLSRAARMVLEAEESKISGEIFNIGHSSENFTKKMIVEAIEAHVPNAKVTYKEGGFDPRNYKVAFDKAYQHLGFLNTRSVNDEIPILVNAVQSGLFEDRTNDPNMYGNIQIG